jgi:hypothetical protein
MATSRVASTALLAAGSILVLSGLVLALGLTPAGLFAGISTIAALLYAGGAWFAAARPAAVRLPDAPVFVFDRERRIVAGASPGEPLISQFPEMLRAEIDRRTAAALAGTSARFPCLHSGRMVVFDVVPVPSPDGAIAYGILVSRDAELIPV